MLTAMRKLFLAAIFSNESHLASKPTRRTERGSRQRSRSCRFEQLFARTAFAIDFGSAMELGGAERDAAMDLAVDSNGNRYVAGYFTGTVDFAPNHVLPGDTLTARGLQDAYVAKYAPDDSLVWARRMGGDTDSTSEYAEQVVVDGTGNVYVGARFAGAADFGTTTLNTSYVNDGVVTKLSANGTFIWAKKISPTTTQPEYVKALALDGAGSLHVASVPYSAITNLSKMDSNGSLRWRKSVTSTTTAFPMDLAIKSDGNIYLGGFFRGTADFDPSNKTAYRSSSDTAGFVLNLSSTGVYKWVSTFQATSLASGFTGVDSIIFDPTGDLVVTGVYDGSVDFNPGPGVSTLESSGGVYVAKLNSAGSLGWVKGFTNRSTGSMVVGGSAVDGNGNIYATGAFKGTVDLDPSASASLRTPNGGLDAYIVKLGPTGNYLWDEVIGGTGNDYVSAIEVDPSNAIHLVGYFEDVVDFNPDPTDEKLLGSSSGKANAFVARWRRS